MNPEVSVVLVDYSKHPFVQCGIKLKDINYAEIIVWSTFVKVKKNLTAFVHFYEFSLSLKSSVI